MARILALESSAELCSVALLNHDDIDGRTEHTPRRHAQRLLPLVDELLSAHSLELRDLDAIAFGCGPGSFTGLRIAAGFAPGLAFGAHLPVVPVSNLRALAFTAAEQRGAGNYLAVLDARMDEVYWSAYQLAEAGNILALTPLCEEQVCAPEQLVLPAELGSGWSVVGSGLVYAERFPATGLGGADLVREEIAIEASAIARLAAVDFVQGKQVEAEQAQPSYIRDEVAWKKLPGRE